MDQLIVLPGNSIKNKVWGESVIEQYGSRFDSVFVLVYDHWESGEQNIDFATEIEKLRAHVAVLQPGTNVYLFAKSVGTLLAFMTIAEKVVAPVRCIFFGIPFDLAATDLFKDAWGVVDTFYIPALAFHNVEDPTTSFSFTKEILESHVPTVTLMATNEADHWYGDFEEYNKTIMPFLKLN
jgi:hypothetical protein